MQQKFIPYYFQHFIFKGDIIPIRSIVLSVILITFFTTGAAQEETAVFGEYYNAAVVGVGGFAPSTGSGDVMFCAGYYHQNYSRILVGGEFSYTRFKSHVFYWNSVRFSTLNITTAVKYVFDTKNIQPHVGGYFGFGLNSINTDDTPGVVLKNSIAGSYGVGVLAGATIPIKGNFFVYCEGRYGGDWMNTELEGNMKKTENYGGLTVMGGLMLLF
jgi:hypothetical protein